MALDPRVIEARIALRVAELRLLAAQTAVEFFAEGRSLRRLPPPPSAALSKSLKNFTRANVQTRPGRRIVTQ